MKKGIFSLIFGVFFVFIAVSIIISPLQGILRVFFIAPFVFFILVAIIFAKIISRVNKTSSNKNTYYDNKNYEGYNNLVPCVNCQTLIDKDFKYCPKCGNPQKNTVICQYCGHENPNSNSLCEKCNGFL